MGEGRERSCLTLPSIKKPPISNVQEMGGGLVEFPSICLADMFRVEYSELLCPNVSICNSNSAKWAPDVTDRDKPNPPARKSQSVTTTRQNPSLVLQI